MLVQEVKDFISNLDSAKTKIKCDQKFLQLFKVYFSTQSAEKELDSLQLQWIEDIFKKRAKKIFDSENDYTIDSKQNNTYWIKLAQSVGKATKKNYLHILIPDTLNHFDAILLNKLTECSELMGFYIGEDGKTLHRVRGLFEMILRKQPLATFNDYTSYQLRPLTLRELKRLRSKKKEGLEFEINNQTYVYFWDYLQRAVMPQWLGKGECPQSLLTSLRSILDIFACDDTENLSKFRRELLAWSEKIKEYPPNDINNLYGQIICVRDKKRYLVDVLLDCLEYPKKHLRNHIHGINQLLDKHQIKKRNDLSKLYSELQGDTTFTLELFQNLLSQLHDPSNNLDKATSALNKKISALLNSLQAKTTFQYEDLICLNEIYHDRWLQVCDTEQDYMRSLEGVNAPWFKLAQTICGKRYNTYRFLMPTLLQDIDSVTLEQTCEEDLSNYILAEGNTELIRLSSCEGHYLSEGTFYNCNDYVAKPLSELEIQRMQYADKQYYKYIELSRANHPSNNPPISIATVMAVKELVEKSLFPIGLLHGRTYNEAQMEEAVQAYAAFYKFVHRLPLDEKKALYSQRIIFHNKNKSFTEIIDLIGQYDNPKSCIATLAQYFMQLVMDYAPNVHFSKAIEEAISMDEMREASCRNVFLEYKDVDEKEALRRLQILFVSLMTCSFSLRFLDGTAVSFAERKNTIPNECMEIFKLLYAFFQEKNNHSACHTYSILIGTIIKPACSTQSFIHSFKQSSKTKNWLNSILSETLFQENILFDPALILTTCMSLVQKQINLSPIMQNFLESMITTYLTAEPEAVKQMQVNIKFTELLNTIAEKENEKKNLLQTLHHFNVGNHVELYAECTAFLAAPQRQMQAQEISFFKSNQAVADAKELLRRFSKRVAMMPKISPQKAPPIPNKEMPDAETKMVISAGSR